MFSFFCVLFLGLVLALPEAAVVNLSLITVGIVGGLVVVQLCSNNRLSEYFSLTWLLDPLRIKWGEIKYRRTSRELIRRHKFKSEAELPRKLQEAISKIIDLLIRDFVTSWYDEVAGGDEEMASESQFLLKEASNKAFNVMKKCDTHKLVRDVILKFLDHVTYMRNARKLIESNSGGAKFLHDDNHTDDGLHQSRMMKAYSHCCRIHPAMTSLESEMLYIRNTVALLLEVLLPPSELNCTPGVFILKEVISCNAILSLTRHVSEPDWINQIIIDILEVMPLEQYRKLEGCHDDDTNKETRKDPENAQKTDTRDRKIKVVAPVSMTVRDVKPKAPVVDKLVFPLSVSRMSSGPTHMPHRLPVIQESNAFDSKESLPRLSSSVDMPLRPTLDSVDAPSQSKFVAMMDDRLPLIKADHFAVRRRSESLPAVCDGTRSGGWSEAASPCLQSDEPVDYASMLTVCGIEDAGVGNEGYKVFVVKYSDCIWSEGGRDQSRKLSRVVKRRYNEFAELDRRLRRIPSQVNLMKGVELPRKRLPFPLSLTVPLEKFLETRQRHLEAYLHILLSKREIRTGQELMNFLAVKTDPDVAFVNQEKSIGVLAPVLAPLQAVSTAIKEGATAIKEGFPIRLTSSNLNVKEESSSLQTSSPFEEVDWKDKLLDSQSAVSVFQAYLETRAANGQSAMSLSVSGIQALSQLARQLQQDEAVDGDERSGVHEPRDWDLIDILVELGIEALSERDSWLLGERVHATLFALFGRVLDRFIADELRDVLTEARWTRYIDMLRDSLWPNGQLRDGNEPLRTEEQKVATKQETLRFLKKFPPGVVRLAAGRSLYDDVMEELLEMVQDPWINRHLIYTLLDLVIQSVVKHSANEILLPEVS